MQARRILLFILFCLLTKSKPYYNLNCTRKGSHQFQDDLPLEVWNEVYINPGQNVFTFGVSTDSSGFLSYSVHSPFNKIWASLESDCPVNVSQYGYNLGLIDRQRQVNDTMTLVICSYRQAPLKGAIKASLFSSECKR